MSEHQPDPGFAATVLGEFSFLSALGFRTSRCDEVIVWFESDRRLVVVSRDPRSYEFDVRIGRWLEVGGQRRRQWFSLRDVVALRRDPAEIGYGGTSAANPALTREIIAKLGDWTRQYAVELLTDGDSLFDQLSAVYSARGIAERDNRLAARLRSRANEAWQRRDFASVIAAYEQITAELTTIDLTPSERGRLRYSRKQEQQQI